AVPHVRVRPRAPESHPPAAGHTACAGERYELRMRLAPRRERLSPYARTVEGVDTLPARDDAAIDERRDQRRELAPRRRQHDLVEQRQSLPDLALGEQRASLQVAREDH